MRKLSSYSMALALAFICMLSVSPQTAYAQRQTEKYENGKKKFQGTIRDGIKSGTHKYWYENGEMQKLERYSDSGILLVVKEWNEEGELIKDEKPEEELEKLREQQFKDIKWWTTEGGVYVYKNKGENGMDIAPTATDYMVHYVIYLENGKEIESSVRRNSPLPINVNTGAMIEGFMLGLRQFKEGERGFIKIPSRLGYGAVGSKGIPPHSTLFFQLIILKAE